MTRISSFYFYLMDLWRRCFNQEYWVEAEKTEKMSDGDEVARHNFRACPRCGVYIHSLDVGEKEKRCWNQCNQIFHRKGIYIDEKGRKFILRKSLYLRYAAYLRIMLAILIALSLAVFRLRTFPDGYEIPFFSLSYWLLVLFVCSVMFLIFSFIVNNRKVATYLDKHSDLGFLGTFAYLCLVAWLFASLQTGCFFSRGVELFWVEILTQEKFYDQQYATLEAMPLDSKRFGFAQEINAKNPRVNLPKEFVRIAKEDFAGMMELYNSYAFQLGYGSPEISEFYGSYQSYLESLDTEELFYQCRFDPWNLASGLAVQIYPKSWELCLKQINSR